MSMVSSVGGSERSGGGECEPEGDGATSAGQNVWSCYDEPHALQAIHWLSEWLWMFMFSFPPNNATKAKNIMTRNGWKDEQQRRPTIVIPWLRRRLTKDHHSRYDCARVRCWSFLIHNPFNVLFQRHPVERMSRWMTGSLWRTCIIQRHARENEQITITSLFTRNSPQ